MAWERYSEDERQRRMQAKAKPPVQVVRFKSQQDCEAMRAAAKRLRVSQNEFCLQAILLQVESVGQQLTKPQATGATK